MGPKWLEITAADMTALGSTSVLVLVVAFFPEKLEKDLLGKELRFRNRPENEILETRFRVMRRGVILGWILGIVTFASGLAISANWYDVKILPDGATTETLRQFASDGCEPIQSNAALFFRCPKLRIR